MSSLKKVLTMAVVLVMVVGTMIPAFALPADVEGTDYEEAAAMLGALDIMVGDAETGNFRPDDPIKRSEFAKIAVISLGLEDAANAARSYSLFPDVSMEHWALGYINVAAGQGIIIGDDTGNYRPDDTITYAEALTILVRALGYKDSFLQGSWPANFISKAAEIDITSGVNIDASQPATRGNSAILLCNALETEVVKQTSFGDDNNWEVSNETLMEENLELTKYEDVTIDAVSKVSAGLEENEVTLTGTSISNGNYEVNENINTANLLGLEADVYMNADDEVVYIDVKTNEDDIITGQITAVDVDGVDKIEVQFADGSTEEYEVVATTVYLNNADAANDYDDMAVGQYGRFTLNEDDQVSFADLYELEDHVVVTSVNTDKEYVKGIKANADSRKIELDSNDGYKIFKNGEEIALEDIEEGNLVLKSADVNELDGEVYTYIFVVDNVINGELSRVRSTEMRIDGTNYNMIDNMSYSFDSGESVSAYDIDAPDATVFEDAVDETVTAYLDLKGDLVYVVTDVEVTSSTLYGVVVKNNEITMDNAKIFNVNGDEIVYTFDEDVDDTNINKGDIVEFELSSDGTIDYDANYNVLATFAEINGGNAKELTVADLDDDHDYLLDSLNNKYYITDDTVIMSYYDSGAADPALVEWEDIEAKDVPANLHAFVVADDNNINAELIIFTENYNLSGDTNVAYLADDMYYDGDWKVDVVMANGNERTFIITNAVKTSGIVEGDFIVFATNESGEMSNVVRTVYDNNVAANVDAVDNTWSIDADQIATISNDVVKLDNGNSYKILDSSNMYELTLNDSNEYDEINEADMSDLDEDSLVRLVLNDEDEVVLLVVVE